MVRVAGLLALFGALIVLVGLAAFTWFVVEGVRNTWAAARRGAPSRRYHLVLAAISLVGALLLAGVPFAAVWAAEAQSGWSDTDGDGMLDGFANGAYDWTDINGGGWLRAASVMITIVVGIAVALSRLVKRAGPGGSTEPHVPWRAEEWGDPVGR